MKYTVTYGRVKNLGDYNSLRIELSEEFNDGDVSREDGYGAVREFVMTHLEEEIKKLTVAFPVKEPARQETFGPPKSPPMREPEKVEDKAKLYAFPTLDGADWRSFDKTQKRAAFADEGGWLFSNAPDSEGLFQVLDREGAAFVLIRSVKFLCKLSKDGKFIQRSLWKEEAK